jgi:hypothetical protein
MNHEAGRAIPVCRFTDLLFHPGQRWGHSDVDMDDSPGADLHNEEDVGNREAGRVLGEEVACPKLLGVIANESPPPSLIATGHAPHHVAADGTGRVVNAELGGQFLSDLVLAPPGLVTGDTLNEGDVLARDPWSADLARA